jgi:peptidoglycan/LPS O-acetylase OafA/YrhL
MPRHNNFDALRFLAAVLVIFSHSFLVAEGSEKNEPLILLSGNQSILGLAAVFVFFAISGFLVTQSYEQTASPLRYLAKRCLRIFPGFFVALVLSAFVLSPLVTTLPLAEYFRRVEPYSYVLNNMMLNVTVHELPGVMFVDNPVGLEINGSLWTLHYEFLMYLMVMALGICRLITVPACILLLAFGMACIYFATPAAPADPGWLIAQIYGVIGFLWDSSWLLSFFAVGMLLYKLRGTRIFDGRIALLALLGLATTVAWGGFIQFFSLFGCYLALWLALNPRLPFIPAARFGDLSYGLYIYGWPAEQAVIWSLGGQATWWQVFLLATPLAAVLAFLSWHLIEKPALRLKPRSARAIAVPALP